MPADRFLIQIRCIQKRLAETHLMQAHIACMSQADENAWNGFRVSLGFTPYLTDLEKAAKGQIKTDLLSLNSLKLLSLET